MISKGKFLTVCFIMLTLSCFAGSQRPNPQFSVNPNPVVLNQEVIFTDLSTKGNCSEEIDSWAWNFGEGASPATATGKGPHSVTYSTFGTKGVSLRVDGPGFCSSKFTMASLVVMDAPIPTMSQWALVIFGLLITCLAVARILTGIKYST